MALNYDQLDRVAKVSPSTNANSSEFLYNNFGYITKVRTAFGASQFVYDKFNKLQKSVDSNNVVTSYKYTPAGGIASISRTFGKTLLTKSTFAYDDLGLLASVTDSKGNIVSVKRDEFNRIVEKTLPNGANVKYDFDKVGNLAVVKDQRENEIKFRYNKLGKLASRQTATGQLTKWTFDKLGRLSKDADSLKGKTDRTANYKYDKFDRVIEIAYKDGSKRNYKYDDYGRLIGDTAITSAKQVSSTILKYDFFGRIAMKKEVAPSQSLVHKYGYNRDNQRTRMQVSSTNGLNYVEKRRYNKYGMLTKVINNGKQKMSYAYDNKGRVSNQVVNGVGIVHRYDKLGRLAGKFMMTPLADGKFDVKNFVNALTKVTYKYANDGQILARNVNGEEQNFTYDKMGQLLLVKANGKNVEQYKYDLAGNMLSKTVNGKATTFTYDATNQLVSEKSADGKVKSFQYDAAGRLVREGGKKYSYNFHNKVVSISGEMNANYDYFSGGQIANATVNNKSENFTWDGLALLKRDATTYLNEPAVTGGNPVAANGKVMFNDMLGTTQGTFSSGKYNSASSTLFGEFSQEKSNEHFFTGKPQIDGIGYAFLFRSYRPELAKWQTSDPLGYPDGFNNFAYVNNGVTNSIDFLGGWTCTFDLFGILRTAHGDVALTYIINNDGSGIVGFSTTAWQVADVFWHEQVTHCGASGCPGHIIPAGEETIDLGGPRVFISQYAELTAGSTEVDFAYQLEICLILLFGTGQNGPSQSTWPAGYEDNMIAAGLITIEQAEGSAGFYGRIGDIFTTSGESIITPITKTGPNCPE